MAVHCSNEDENKNFKVYSLVIQYHYITNFFKFHLNQSFTKPEPRRKCCTFNGNFQSTHLTKLFTINQTRIRIPKITVNKNTSQARK